MTSIASVSTPLTPPSPRDRIEERIASATSSGKISAADQSALSTALESIESDVTSAPAGDAKPADARAKMASLIQQQVDSGKLTEDQATELKGFFAKGHHGGGHHGKVDAVPPAPADTAANETQGAPATGAAQAANAPATAAAGTAQAGHAAHHGKGHGHHHHGGGAGQTPAIDSFLNGLRDGNGDSTNYSATGTADAKTGTIPTGLVIDTRA